MEFENSFLQNTLSNYLKVELPDDQVYFRRTRASNKAKTRRKTNVNLLCLEQDNHSLGCIHFLQVALSLVSEEWPRVGNGPGSAIRDMHSLGQIHSLHVTLCLVSEEWPRVRNGPRNKNNHFSLF
jgi:hypothetical protein